MYLNINGFLYLIIMWLGDQGATAQSGPIQWIGTVKLSMENINVVVAVNQSALWHSGEMSLVQSGNITFYVTSPYVSYQKSSILYVTDVTVKWLQEDFPITLLGVQYDVNATLTTKSKKWSLSTLYKSEPLPPTNFRFRIHQNKVIFQFRRPAHVSETGVNSVFDYLKVKCSKGYLTTDDDGTRQWTANFTESMIGDDENVQKGIFIQRDMVYLFQPGNFVNCTIAAISLRGGVVSSILTHSSFAIEPAIPEVSLHDSVKNKGGVNVTLLIKERVAERTFSLIQLRYSALQECTRTFREFVNKMVYCQLGLPVSGSLYQFNVTAYSLGPENGRKSSSVTIPIIVPPLPPKALDVVLLEGKITVTPILESSDLHPFHYLHLNSSDDPAFIDTLNVRESSSGIKWHKLPPGVTNVFNCWTSVTFGRKRVLSKKIAADYASEPSAPIRFTGYFHGDGLVTFQWRNGGTTPVDSFVLSICDPAGNSCLDEIHLNYTSRNNFELMDNRQVDKPYLAWVQAVFYGKRSPKSNMLSITKEGIFSLEETDDSGATPYVPIAIFAGVVLIICVGILTIVCIARPKLRTAVKVSDLECSPVDESLDNSVAPAIDELAEDKLTKMVRKLSVQQSRKWKNTILVAPSMSAIEEKNATYYYEGLFNLPYRTS